jgi:hypothetical protein
MCKATGSLYIGYICPLKSAQINDGGHPEIPIPLSDTMITME